jgi:hypothetical protein
MNHHGARMKVAIMAPAVAAATVMGEHRGGEREACDGENQFLQHCSLL